MAEPGTIRALERKPLPTGEAPSESTDDELESAPPRESLCCRACGSRVADLSQVIHDLSELPHVYVNPHGRVFELILARRAHSYMLVGDATSEFTWFAGFTWQIAVCKGCLAHLGWRYVSESPGLVSSFFGFSRSAVRETGD